MEKMFKLLTINPGSTSTKVAYFRGSECISGKSLSHSSAELDRYATIAEQYPLRKQAILDYLSDQNIDYMELDAVVGRGGLLKPLKGGTYQVNQSMLDDLNASRYGQHASNLGAIIAREIASLAGIPAYIVNPVVVDEFEPLARFSGLPEFQRKSAFHALNQKAMAMKFAKEAGKSYEELNLIIAHLGGGISVGAHKKGRVIDVNNGLEEGPFSPERTGSLPVNQLVDFCFSGGYSKEEIKKKLVGKGGLVAYTGTSDAREIEQRMEQGDEYAALAFEAMSYQVAKEIGACSTVLCGKVDAIILTGGIARSSKITRWITERVDFIAPVTVYPGEDEMAALAEGAVRVLEGKEQPLEYL
ncbi:MAG: butyrate kinase [Clostridia bacterium]|nr:butyrate kinase [Clostridia bacterium]